MHGTDTDKHTHNQLTVGSLFSGIGGMELGLERAGMRVVWQVEIDPYASRVLAKHWPDVTRFRDVRDCGAHNLAAVDLICGGFPCQPFSTAGKRRGQADDRYLWPEMARIVAELRPRFVLAENVPGIFVLLDEVLADLESQGYEAWAVDLPAIAFNAPHIRRRTFVVAHAEDNRRIGDGDFGTGIPTVSLRPHAIAGGAIVAHATGVRCEGNGKLGTGQPMGQTETGSYPVAGGQDVPHTNGKQVGRSAIPRSERDSRDIESDLGRTVARLSGGLDGTGSLNAWVDGWEDGIPRVANGVPHRVDRLRCLGNSVVPQVAEFIGRLIMQAHTQGA